MPAIAFDHVSKAFRRGAGPGSLREAVAHLGRRWRGPAVEAPLLWALRDVSFAVERGETLALIGANGAGKTTVLKLLSRVMRPSEGRIRVDGRVAALIELGAGFHPDLTGRENVFLYGAILGLDRRQVRARFDAVVAFAELEEFIDTPLKRYSSGMALRLGFAVAVHADPEVLLVDEVLAVGDLAFQRTCLDRIDALRAAGATIVFVSHHLRDVESLCRRALWLDHGRVRESGEAPAVVAAYANAVHRAVQAGERAARDGTVRRGSGEVALTAVRVLGADGAARAAFRMGERLVLEIGYRAHRPVERPSVDVAIYARTGVRVCTATTRLSGRTPPVLAGEGTVRCVLDAVPFTPGGYAVTVAIFDRDDAIMYDQWHRVAGFVVESEVVGEARWQLRQDEHGVVYLPVRWEP